VQACARAHRVGTRGSGIGRAAAVLFARNQAGVAGERFSISVDYRPKADKRIQALPNIYIYIVFLGKHFPREQGVSNGYIA